MGSSLAGLAQPFYNFLPETVKVFNLLSGLNVYRTKTLVAIGSGFGVSNLISGAECRDLHYRADWRRLPEKVLPV